MSAGGQGDYVCQLSDEVIKRAEEELKETPERRTTTLQALRDKINSNSALKIRTDDAFLLRFLRVKKFDLDRAYDLVVKHYASRVESDNAGLFENLRPSAVKLVLESEVMVPLTQRDKLGRKVLLFRPGRWDPSRFSINDIFRNNYICLSKIVQEEETQINGVVMIADLKDMGWSQVKCLSPFYFKRVTSMIQDSFPLRFKGINYVHEPRFMDYIFSLIRPFLKEKLLKRIQFHGDSYDKLVEMMGADCLPEQYGGNQPPASGKEWMESLLKCDAEFDEEAKYGLLKSTGNTSSKAKEDAIGGLVGSYKKLDI